MTQEEWLPLVDVIQKKTWNSFHVSMIDSSMLRILLRNMFSFSILMAKVQMLPLPHTQMQTSPVDIPRTPIDDNTAVSFKCRMGDYERRRRALSVGISGLLANVIEKGNYLAR